MEKVLVGVVEDELIIAESIIDSLESLGYSTTGPAMNYTEALEMVEQDKPDILLLDIILSGKKDGIDLAWQIKESYDLPFIFLTSHADRSTIEKAKKVDPPAYLVKPFNRDDLYSAIEIALFNYKNRSSVESIPKNEENPENYLFKDALFIKDKSRYIKLKFSDILFLKNDHVYINVFTNSGKYLVRSNMPEFLKKFPKNFYRVHRSYAINLEHLDSIEGDLISIEKHQIPVAKNYRQELISKINIG